MTVRHFLLGILLLLASHSASAQVGVNNRFATTLAINAGWIFQPNTVTPTLNRFPVRVGGRWGYCDSLGNLAITPAYDAAADFENGIGVVQQGNKAYAVDSSGRIITPEGFDMLRVIYGNMLAYYEFFGADGDAGGWGLITTSGKKILPAKYSDISSFFGGVIGYKADSLWGYINPDGQIITEPIYDTALVLRNRTLMLVKGKKT
ncbi:MAG: WG repeat-containing protein, partial [Bacteroidia bacterium]